MLAVLFALVSRSSAQSCLSRITSTTWGLSGGNYRLYQTYDQAYTVSSVYVVLELKTVWACVLLFVLLKAPQMPIVPVISALSHTSSVSRLHTGLLYVARDTIPFYSLGCKLGTINQLLDSRLLTVPTTHVHLSFDLD